MEGKEIKSYDEYREYYSNRKLWHKISEVAKTAGAKVVYAALLLYYVSTSRSVSMTDKAKIYGALGYFILPTDLIPDFITVVGYTDDLSVLLLALKTVRNNITPEIHEKAYRRLTSWFGDVDRNELQQTVHEE